MKKCVAILTLLVLIHPNVSLATTRRVGSGQTYATVAAAHSAAVAGDSIVIYPGNYNAQFTTFTKSGLRILGVGTRPVFNALSQLENSNDKGIFYFTSSASDIVVDNVELRGAMADSSAGNGAGIRIDSGNPGPFTIQNCKFADNEDGILGFPNNFTVQYNEFDTNGYKRTVPSHVGQSHAIYVNGASNLVTFRGNYSHNQHGGHEFKSRALESRVLYNFFDDQNETCDRNIDISDGGRASIVGNVLIQGPNSPNSNILGFSKEGANSPLELNVINNTFVNNKTSGGVPTGSMIDARAGTTGKAYNNIFYGAATVGLGTLTAATNYTETSASNNSPGFVDEASDFHLTGSSPSTILNFGTTPGTAGNGFNLTPTFQFSTTGTIVARPTNGALDLGAYELSTGVDASFSYFVPQAGPLNSPNTLEGAAAIAYAVTCPNNDLLNNGARLKIVLATSTGAPLPGIPASTIFAQLNGGTASQGFSGAGDDTIFANSLYSSIAHCPDLRFITADAATDASGTAYIYWKGTGGIRSSNRKWGMFAGSIPVYAAGVQLSGRLTTLSANGTYTAHVKNIDTEGTELDNGGEIVNSLDLNPVQAAVGGAYDYHYDFNNDGIVDDNDVQFIRQHTNHRCNYPLNP